MATKRHEKSQKRRDFTAGLAIRQRSFPRIFCVFSCLFLAIQSAFSEWVARTLA